MGPRSHVGLKLPALAVKKPYIMKLRLQSTCLSSHPKEVTVSLWICLSFCRHAAQLFTSPGSWPGSGVPGVGSLERWKGCCENSPKSDCGEGPRGQKKQKHKSRPLEDEGNGDWGGGEEAKTVRHPSTWQRERERKVGQSYCFQKHRSLPAAPTLQGRGALGPWSPAGMQ